MPHLLPTRTASFSPLPTATPAGPTATGGTPSTPTSRPDGEASPVHSPKAGSTMRRLSMLAQRAQTSAGSPLEVTITGGTNSVGIDGKGSIFDGKELQSFHEGDKITIDADHPIFSRRGPNQEVLGNHKEDGNSTDKAHVWYPQHHADTSKYHSDDWAHIRADTFTTVAGVLGTSLDKATPVQVRPRAAPTSGYKSIGDFSSPKDFIEHQKQYQNTLKKDHLKAGILASHRSVGFEYEFTGHSLQEAGSHISLASSEKHSELFGIRFELETDSGAVVEIGMPPFIVPNKADGKPDKAELQAIHLKMSGAMLNVRQEAGRMLQKGDVDLPTFVGLLEKHGLGSGWNVSTDPRHKETLDNIKIKEPTSQKLAGDKIYAQMNISMNGDESGQLIASARQAFADLKNAAEESALGAAFEELDGLAKARLGGNGREEAVPAHVVHLNKALANTLAIPSILHQKEMDSAGDEDLSSAVKELYSVWVKDSLPNILATTSASPAELAELKAFARDEAKPVVMNRLGALLPTLTTLTDARKPEFAAWAKLGELFPPDGYFDGASLEMLSALDRRVTGTPAFAPILRSAEALAATMDGDGEFIDKEGKPIGSDDARYAAADASYQSANQQFNQLVAQTVRAHSEAALFHGIAQTVEAEIDRMIDRIGTPDVVGVPSNVAFQNEAFGQGDGIGVRKDTQIPHDAADAAKLRHSVVEVRNGAAMEHYFKS